MFRDTKKSNDLDKKHFGIGSIICAGGTKAWLLVQTSEDTVGVIDLSTMTIVPDLYITSLDVTHVTSKEADYLVSGIGELNRYASSDFTMVQEGIKNATYRY